MTKAAVKKYLITGAIALAAVAIANRFDKSRRLING